jgi:hypothetical protein
MRRVSQARQSIGADAEGGHRQAIKSAGSPGRECDPGMVPVTLEIPSGVIYPFDDNDVLGFICDEWPRETRAPATDMR